MNTEAIRALEARYEAEIADLRAQLEAVGAGGVNGGLMSDLRPDPNAYPVPMPPTAQPAEPAVSEARPMGTAPRNDTTIRLLVQFEDGNLRDTPEPHWTIGHNGFDNSGIDEWMFAGWNWTHDCYTQGTGVPIGWLPFDATTPKPQQSTPAMLPMPEFEVVGYMHSHTMCLSEFEYDVELLDGNEKPEPLILKSDVAAAWPKRG